MTKGDSHSNRPMASSPIFLQPVNSWQEVAKRQGVTRQRGEYIIRLLKYLFTTIRTHTDNLLASCG